MVKKKILKIGIWFSAIVLGIFLLITGGLYFFKDEICGYVISEVNVHLKAKVKVAKVDLAFWGSFPNLSVDFNQVFIQDSYKNSTEKDTLLYSDRIRLKFNPMDIWNEKYNVKAIDISPGTINLKINSKGVTNYDILKDRKDTSNTKFNLTLDQVAFEKIRFSFNNEETGHYYATFLTNLDLEGAFSEKEFTLHSKSNLFVKQAKSGSVSLISNKPAYFDLNILVNQSTNTFEISNALLYIANLPFNINGKVVDEKINFRIHANNLELKDVVNNISHNSIEDVKKMDGSGKVHFNVTIVGDDQNTNVNCDFGIKDGSLIEPAKGLKLNNINLNGKYSNEGGKENEYLRLSNISFLTAGGPFSGDVELTNFDAPIYTGKGKGNIDLSIAQRLFPNPEIDSIIGNIDVNSEFNIQESKDVNQEIHFNIQKCEGDISLNNVGLKLKQDKRFFNSLNGSIYLRENEVGLDAISMNVGNSDIKINGVFNNIIGYLKKENKLEADVSIKSDFLDIQDLSIETKQEQIEDGKNWILPNDILASISLNAGEIKYENHRFKKFKGNLNVKENALEFLGLTVQNANADVKGDLLIEEKLPEIFTITTQLSSDNIEFKSLFREWNNFDQTDITEENISGKAHIILDFKSSFDLENGVNKNAIKALVRLKISDGKLKNVSTLKQISQSLKSTPTRLLLKKSNILEFEKNLLDLKFEEFENTLIIKNGQVEIPSMLIKSNAIDIELYGKHSFEDIIDYHFSFNLRQIRKSKTEEEFGEVQDDNQGIKVFLKMYGNGSNPTIEWDQTAKKEQAKANREAAKSEAKSIFKSEFGMFKNDTTVKTQQQVKAPKEELQIEFGNTKKEEIIEEPKKKKKELRFNSVPKIGNTLKKWKEESEKDKKEEF